MNKENLKSKGYISSRSHRVIKRGQSPKEHQVVVEENLLNQQDAYKAYMKYLIASNTDYFQSKLHVNLKGRPKDLRFKVPCRTPSTIYKKDYYRKKPQFFDQNPLRVLNLTSEMASVQTYVLKEDQKNKEDNKFDGKTVYQRQFTGKLIRTQSARKKKGRAETLGTDVDAPRYFETSNRIQFLNWAGKNYVPSMKPENRPAITHAPFQASSVYRSDFEGKKCSPTSMIVRESSFPKFCNAPVMMRSNYSQQFGPKKCGWAQMDCRPCLNEVGWGASFKGSTQYKRQFTGTAESLGEAENERSLAQLQTLIIDL